jgi:hypothetical protein
MSWFYYGDQSRRRYRVGIWLRVQCLDAELLTEALKWLREGEAIQRVVVKELRPNNQVLLEFWCNKPFGWLEDPRYTVFHLQTPEDYKWVCEGDLGRGLILPNKTKRNE